MKNNCKVSYHTRCDNNTGDVYRQTISMDLKTFKELQLKVDAEKAMEYPQKDKYIFTCGYETFLKPLELYKNAISYLTLTQARFIDLYLKLNLKTDRNTCIIIRRV